MYSRGSEFGLYDITVKKDEQIKGKKKNTMMDKAVSF
jgi:hypothetical protein